MVQITLAKALKLKNRLAGRLAKIQVDIQRYNSVLKEQYGMIDVPNKIKVADQIVEALIGLKTEIIISNAEIQEVLIRMGECRAKLNWMVLINTRDGEERHYQQNTPQVWTAHLKKQDIDNESAKLEAVLDAMQDKVDNFNHTKKIAIPQEWLDLAS